MFTCKAEDMKNGIPIGAEETYSRDTLRADGIRILEYVSLCFSLWHATVCEKRLTCKGGIEGH